MKVWVVGEKATDREGVAVYAKTAREAGQKVIDGDLSALDLRVVGPKDFKSAKTRNKFVLEDLDGSRFTVWVWGPF